MVSLFEVEVETWVVVFSTVREPHWWDRFLRPGFNHCYAYRAIGDGTRWILYNPSLTHTQIDVRPLDATDDPTTSCALLYHPIRSDRRRPWFLFGHLTCVEYVKAALSIRNWWLFTPNQLHRWLVNAGARDLAHGTTIQETQTARGNGARKGTATQAAQGRG